MSGQDIDPNEHPVRANRGIVIVVVTLGAMIVLGLGGLVYGIAMKAGKLGADDPVIQTAPAPSVVTSSGGTVRSIIPHGDRLAVHVTLPGGKEVVRVYNSRGELLFEIDPFSR